MRGYIHLITFFFALGACFTLITENHQTRIFSSIIIYSLCLTGLYGVSSIYHCIHWSRPNYLLMKRIDHAFIFALIAGTATPICLLGLKETLGRPLLLVIWLFATLGMLVTVFWPHSPKWFRACIYLALGWLAVPFLTDIEASLGTINLRLLLGGGIVYTLGAMVYAFKKPDPFPRYFGYHEIFHLFVVIASGLHFAVIYRLSAWHLF